MNPRARLRPSAPLASRRTVMRVRKRLKRRALASSGVTRCMYLPRPRREPKELGRPSTSVQPAGYLGLPVFEEEVLRSRTRSQAQCHFEVVSNLYERGPDSLYLAPYVAIPALATTTRAKAFPRPRRRPNSRRVLLAWPASRLASRARLIEPGGSCSPCRRLSRIAFAERRGSAWRRARDAGVCSTRQR